MTKKKRKSKAKKKFVIQFTEDEMVMYIFQQGSHEYRGNQLSDKLLDYLLERSS